MNLGFQDQFVPFVEDNWGPKITEGDGWISIGGMKLRCYGRREYIGNFAWNRYWLTGKDIERLINWPRFRKWFALTGGSGWGKDTVRKYEEGLTPEAGEGK